MITENITQQILFDPIFKGANKLLILSSYASPNMSSWYMDELINKKTLPIDISVIVGMTSYSGISVSVHNGFLLLHNKQFPKQIKSFCCNYLYEAPHEHSNLYIWLKDNNPEFAFVGSADFTQNSFISSRHEIMEKCSPHEAYEYYLKAEKRSCFCNYAEIEDMIKISKSHPIFDLEINSYNTNAFGNLPNVKISLLTNKGDIGKVSCLNWGQRKGRNKNEAYIRIPVEIAKKNFFPLNRHFIVTTDDHHTLILRVEQTNNKALTTPLNNSLLGEYFRNRLNLANGQFITKEILEHYGRTDVTFIKIDDEQYFMDFSPNELILGE